ncbi:MAG: copper resistance protein CopC [Chloroflexi bacterium]|nr:copper resistance protein CopC [Chloroflexota bacterium]
MPLPDPRRPFRRSSAIVAGALVLALIGSLAVPPAASAHAELVTADPLPNASLVEPPERLSITFSEPIDPDRIRIELLDLRLQPQPGLGAVTLDADGTRLVVELPALDPNVYTVRYSVLSTVDGHATTGSYSFIVDPSGTQAPPTSEATSESPSADAWAVGARWIALIAGLVALGSLLAWANARRVLGAAPPWRLVAGAALLGVAALTGYLVLSARTIPGTEPSLDPLAPYGWTPFAIAMRVALVSGLLGFVVAVVGATRGGRSGIGLALGGALLLAVALAGMSAGGHAASLGGPLNAALDWLHLVAAAAWLGGLPALLFMARRAPAAEERAGVRREPLRRHGRLALIAAPLVILTGLANSPVVLGASRDLVASEYGNLLIAKATLASVAIGIGAANHLLVRGRGRGSAWLLVGTELVVASVAVMAAATMVTIQPAAARQDVVIGPAIQPAHFFGEAGPASVHASVSVPAPGSQSYQVTVRDVASGAPRDDIQRVFLAFTPPEDSGLAQQRVELEPGELEGLYAARGAYTPVVGEWEMDVVVRREGALDESVAFGMLVEEPSPPIVAPPPDTGLGVPGPLAALWAVLPGGLAGWVPAVVFIGAAGFVGRQRRGLAVQAPVIGLALVLILGAGSRSLVEAANDPSARELAPHTALPDGDPEVGRRIYLANCAACHGPDGAGDGPVQTSVTPGPLDRIVPDMSDAEVSYRIANGVAGTPMPGFAATLTERDRADLVSYLRDRWGPP